VRVSRVACALAKKGYNVSPQWLVNGSCAGRDGKGKERGLGSRPRLSPDLGEVSCALLASSVVCLCISSSFVGCTGRPHPPQDFMDAFIFSSSRSMEWVQASLLFMGRWAHYGNAPVSSGCRHKQNGSKRLSTNVCGPIESTHHRRS
jgi:hypothetical protein